MQPTEVEAALQCVKSSEALTIVHKLVYNATVQVRSLNVVLFLRPLFIIVLHLFA